MLGRLAVLALLGSSLAALAPARVSAQCPGGAVVSLSSNGWTWDFAADGSVVDGNGAFDGLYRLYIDGAAFNPIAVPWMMEGTRGAVFQSLETNYGVRRHVLVPTGESYVRYIDEIVNRTAAERTFVIELRTNSGYDNTQEVVSSSSGNNALEAADRSFVLDNELVDLPPDPPFMLEETPPPPSCFVLGAPTAPSTPTAITPTGGSCGGFPASSDGATVRFSLTIPPMRGVTLLYFAALGATRADAMAVCANLATLPMSTYSDLSGAERDAIVNWALGLPVGTACAGDSACESGFCNDGVCCATDCGDSTGDCQACAGSAGSTAADGTCGVVRSTHACRPPASTCDLLELCDGTSRTCPADVVRAAGFICRAASPGQCDVPEMCNGSSPNCPTDAVLPAGTFCGGATEDLPCMVGETCDGIRPVCPILAPLPDRYECPTTAACTFGRCLAGVCVPSPACDDGDPCTMDSCTDGVSCDENPPMAGCDGGLTFEDGGGLMFPDAGGSGDEDGGGSSDFDAGEIGDMDGGIEDAGRRMDAPRRDGDPLTPAELTVGGGGCACRTGRRDPGAAVLGLAVIALAVLVRGIGRARRGR